MVLLDGNDESDPEENQLRYPLECALHPCDRFMPDRTIPSPATCQTLRSVNCFVLILRSHDVVYYYPPPSSLSDLLLPLAGTPRRSCLQADEKKRFNITPPQRHTEFVTKRTLRTGRSADCTRATRMLMTPQSLPRGVCVGRKPYAIGRMDN